MIEWTNKGWPEALCNSHTGNTDGDPTSLMQGSSISPLVYRRLASEQTAVASLIGFSDSNDVTISARGRGGEQVGLQYVSANYFPSLGVAPLLGRVFSQDDDRVGREVVVVISHRLWQRMFEGRADAVGSTLRVNGVLTTIVGVAPRTFFGISIGEWVDVFTPLAAKVTLTRAPGDTSPLAEDAMYWWVRQIARLSPGADATTARAAADAAVSATGRPRGRDPCGRRDPDPGDLVGAARIRPHRNRRRPRAVGAASPGRPGAAHRLCQRREPACSRAPSGGSANRPCAWPLAPAGGG